MFKSDGEQLDLPFLDDAEEQDEEDEDEDEELDEDEDRDDVGMRMFLDSSFWTGLNAELWDWLIADDVLFVFMSKLEMKWVIKLWMQDGKFIYLLLEMMALI